MKTDRNTHLKFRLAASIAPDALLTAPAVDAILADPAGNDPMDLAHK
jgi:hypothetical protein